MSEKKDTNDVKWRFKIHRAVLSQTIALNEISKVLASLALEEDVSPVSLTRIRESVDAQIEAINEAVSLTKEFMDDE